jgi:hypothetical protein
MSQRVCLVFPVRWNKEQLFDKYYANPVKIQKEAGVRS